MQIRQSWMYERSIRREALSSHHEGCDFSPVKCSYDSCEATVNRQDLVSHQQACEFRSVTCNDCHEAMRQREYRKHPCAFRNELDESKRGLAEVWRVLREIQDEQLRQGEEMRQMARELRQPHTTQGQRDNNLRQQTSGHLGQQASETVPTRRQQSDNSKQPDSTQPQQGYNRIPSGPSCTKSDYVETVLIPSPIQSKATVNKQIVVAGGGSKSYEIFDWSTQQWTLHKDTLFFDYTDGFSFVYDNKIMICGGTRTNKVECLDISDHRSVSTFPAQLVNTECGKGVLCGDRILTFGESVSTTSLKPPFKTTVISYSDRAKLSRYGVACVNENTVVVLGGYHNTPYRATELKEDVLLYNPTTKGMKKPLPHQLADMAVVVRDDNLIVLGGHKNHDYAEICSDVLMYNITKQQCSKLPSMLENRSGCAAVIMGDTIIAIGGNSENERHQSVVVKTVEYLVLGEDTWRKLPPMHCERSGATACLFP